VAVIRPFRALRPPVERAKTVASVPYDVVNTEEAKALADGNELSFLHVSRPEIDLPGIALSFNVAHSGGIVVCAVAREAEVGIDIEDRTRARLDRDLVERYCSPTEVADVVAQPGDGWRDQFLRYWTLKEAYLKARGLGIAVHLSHLAFRLASTGDVTLEFLDSLAGADPAWAFDLRALGDDHFVAVAASTPQGVRPAFALDPLPPEWLP